MKILAIVDRKGLAFSVSTHAANHHEVRCVRLSLDFYILEAKLKKLLNATAFDSDRLDAEFENEGVEPIAPTAPVGES